MSIRWPGSRLTVLPMTVNGGFASGCNRGLEAGSAPYVLFLNPDARIDVDAFGRLVSVLASDAGVGLVAPCVLADGHGSLEYSQRRYPRVRSTFAQAFLLPRLLPRATWATNASATHGRTPRAATASGCRAPACSSGGARSRRSAGGTRASSSMARTSTSAAAYGRAGYRVQLRALGHRDAHRRRVGSRGPLDPVSRARANSVCPKASAARGGLGSSDRDRSRCAHPRGLHDAGARCQGRAGPSVEGGDLLRRDASPHSLTACGDPNGGWSGRTITSNVWRGPCAESAESFRSGAAPSDRASVDA